MRLIIRMAPPILYGVLIGWVISTIPGTSFAHEYLGYAAGASLYGIARFTVEEGARR